MNVGRPLRQPPRNGERRRLLRFVERNRRFLRRAARANRHLAKRDVHRVDDDAGCRLDDVDVNRFGPFEPLVLEVDDEREVIVRRRDAARELVGGGRPRGEQDEHGHNRMTESHPFSLRVILDGAGRTE